MIFWPFIDECSEILVFYFSYKADTYTFEKFLTFPDFVAMR